MLRNVRLAFPVLNEPEQFQGSGPYRYSATLLIPSSDTAQLDNVKKAMRAAAAAKFGEEKADAAVKALTAANKVALGNGDNKADYDGFEGCMFVSAHSRDNAPPKLLDGQRNELPRSTGTIYAGCMVNASVEFWGQANEYGKRINAQIRGVQFAGDGDAFAASRPASADEFDVVEGAEATDADFA